MLIVVLLSLAAAALLAGAAVLQQRAAARSKGAPREAAPGSRGAVLPGAAFVRHIARDPLWLAGWGVNVTGFLTQAAALHEGSITVVQPVLVTQLLFTLLFAALAARTHLRWGDYLGAAAIGGGLALLLTLPGATAAHSSHGDRPRLIAAVVAGLVLAGLLVAAASRVAPVLRAPVLGIAAGLFFALSAAVTTLTTDDLFNRGIAATAVDWVGYTLALTTALGLVLEQDSFASGPLPLAMTGMTVTNPVASYVLGVLAFHAPLPTSAGLLATIAVSAALVAAGVALIAHSPLLAETERAAVAGSDDDTEESGPWRTDRVLP